jgi:hypothetical protein
VTAMGEPKAGLTEKAQKQETARDAAILAAQYKTLTEIRNASYHRSKTREASTAKRAAIRNSLSAP